MTAEPPRHGRPFRRRVYYLPGFDPMPARSYRERYRREAARQAGISGYRIETVPMAERSGCHWRVRADIGGRRTETDFEILEWSDIVKGSMGHGVFATYGLMLRTMGIYLRSGAFPRLMRLRKGPTVAALYPVVVLSVELLIALGAGIGAAMVLSANLPGGAAFQILSALVGLGVSAALLAVFSGRDRLHARYLLQDYAFSARECGAYPAVLSARLDDFADRVAAGLRDGPDEVLVIGHSSGAHLAVTVVARLLRAGRVPGTGPVLSLLTLGQVVPMVSLLPDAEELRGDLAFVSISDRLSWIDVSAPGDCCAFALCDPVAVSGMAGPEKRWPIVLSAAFSRPLSRESRRALRWRFFERHFQYLNAFDALPDDASAYDYFAITAGPLTLAARLRARSPSENRIERPLRPAPRRAA